MCSLCPLNPTADHEPVRVACGFCGSPHAPEELTSPSAEHEPVCDRCDAWWCEACEEFAPGCAECRAPLYFRGANLTHGGPTECGRRHFPVKPAPGPVCEHA